MIEFVMVPFLLARRKQIWLISTIVLVGCVLGALVGYGIGRFFFESAGQWLIDTFGLSGGMEKFRNLFDDYGFGALILVCITPIPFQAAMLAAGAASYSLPMFLLATLIGRGIRYYGLAAIVALMGEKAEEVWQKHTFWITAGTVIVVVLTYVISSFSIF
ncbi:MAG: VTT domain-containing protein [Verrucomicrobiota bacterium JB023]|nr:VTT domain-containing protein [Verrucomicrobiota bacterium JB023]